MKTLEGYENISFKSRESETYIVRIECLPIRGVFQKESLEAQDLAYSTLRGGREITRLDLVDLVFSNDLLQDFIELVQNFYPGMEVGTRPLP